MAGHTSEKRWRSNQTPDSGTGVSILVRDSTETVITALSQAEIQYQDLLELYAFAGGTAQLLADQLFYENWSVRESDPIGNPGVTDTEANATEVSMATDLINAVTAMHELYEAANNVVVTQEDRFAQLRRMS